MAMYKDEPENPVFNFVAIIIGIIYVAAAALCVLCLTTDIITEWAGKLITSLNEEALQALVKLYGYMILALMPSAILFLASRAPIEMSLFLRIVLWIVGALGMAGLIWLFFSISGQSQYAELLGNTTKDLYGILWLRVSTIVAAVGLFTVNVMSNFMPNFNSANALASFMEFVWGFFAELNTGYVIYILLSFVTLPWAFLILPVAGIIIFTGIVTLTAVCNMD